MYTFDRDKVSLLDINELIDKGLRFRLVSGESEACDDVEVFLHGRGVFRTTISEDSNKIE